MRPTAFPRLRAEVLEARLAPAAGELDLAFNGTGRVPADVNEYGSPAFASDVALQADGKLVVLGTENDAAGDADLKLFRLNYDGSRDLTFGVGGVARVSFFDDEHAVFTSYPVGAATPVAVAVQPDGRILVAATVMKYPHRFGVARLTPDGLPDPTFDGDGEAEVALRHQGTDRTAGLTALALQPDGKVVLAGYAVVDYLPPPPSQMLPPGFAVDQIAAVAVRLNADGSPDAGFGQGGQWVQAPALPLRERADAVTVQDDGRILLAGSTASWPDPARPLLIRLTAAGELDPTFDGDGRLTPITLLGTATDVVALRDGKILLAGGTGPTEAESVLMLMRFNADGSFDPTFDGDGTVTDPTRPRRYGRDVAMQANGRIVVLRTEWYYAADGSIGEVVRFNADGSRDLAFGGNGSVEMTGPTTAIYGGQSLLLRPDGAIVVGNGLGVTQFVGDPVAGVVANPFRETIAAGAGGARGAVVALLRPEGTTEEVPLADAAFVRGARVAQGDVNGDGVDDLVVGSAPGGPARVLVLDGKTRAELFRLDPFESSFTGGVYVAAGDVDGDGFADVAISPDEGGGPRVRIFSGRTQSQLADFFGIEDPNFRGGARVALGDLNADGVADLLVAAGFGGGPRLAGFGGTSLRPDQSPVKLFTDFFVFEQTLRNGVFVAAGDVTGDGFADLVVGGGPGGGPRVFGLSGKDLVESFGATLSPAANFFAGDATRRDGVTVAVKDLDGDARADVVAGSGSRVRAYAGKAVTSDGAATELFQIDAFPGLGNGVFVG